MTPAEIRHAAEVLNSTEATDDEKELARAALRGVLPRGRAKESRPRAVAETR